MDLLHSLQFIVARQATIHAVGERREFTHMVERIYVDYHDRARAFVVKLLIMIQIMMGLLRNTKILPHENHPLYSDECMFLENVYYLLVLYPNH